MGVQIHEDRYGKLQLSWTPAGTAAGPITASQTTQALGLRTTDQILNVTPPSTTAGLAIVGASCSADDVLEVTFGNFSTGALTSASGTYSVYIFRAEAASADVNTAIGV